MRTFLMRMASPRAFQEMKARKSGRSSIASVFERKGATAPSPSLSPPWDDGVGDAMWRKRGDRERR